MRYNVFTYGSLMFPAVWEQIVRVHCLSCTATLNEYGRYAVADAAYPGMIAQAGSAVEGVLYLDVDPADVARLDAFEGNEYRRAAVQVCLADGRHMDAQTYLFTAIGRLDYSAWDADAFDIVRFMAIHCSHP